MSRFLSRLALAGTAFASTLLPLAAQYTQITLPPITVKLEDYATAPQTGASSTYLARINFMHPQPGNSNRFWVNDSSGRLYIVDHDDKEWHVLLNLNGTGSNGGIFASMYVAGGFSWGLITFQFHPQYAQVGMPGYGKFYTVHSDAASSSGSARLPNNTNFPGLTTTGYTTTTVQATPGTNTATAIHSVLIEWTDTNVDDYAFTGTAREMLRSEGNERIHPLGDLLFNPLATNSSHPDWENLYLAHGDGADGEKNDVLRHPNPQSLATLNGKILRINVADPDGAGAARYGIPASNPFVGTAGARGEIFAYGFRNPHRFSWDIEPSDPTNPKLWVTDIGFHDAEEVDLVVAGNNYGWAEREGTRASLTPPGTGTQALPLNDSTFGYTYPVISYPHSDANDFEFGDAIAGGFVYRGTAIPELQGKYVFGDITTARLFYANLADMNAAHDGVPGTIANIGVLNFRWDDPDDSLGAGLLTFDHTGNFTGSISAGYQLNPPDRGYFTIILDAYRARGGTSATTALPGAADSTGIGRADVRWAVDENGELFLLSKSDGLIRRAVAAPSAPSITAQPGDEYVVAGTTAEFTAAASGLPTASLQWQRQPAGGGGFTNLANDATYSGVATGTLSVANTTVAMTGDQFRVVATNSEGSATSNPATLSVAKSAWHLAHFTPAQLADPAISGDTVDLDGDGLNNLLEYGFNLDPWIASAGSMPQPVTIDGGTKLQIEFDQLQAGLNYGVEVSTDLVNWDDDTPDNPNFEVTVVGNHVTATYILGTAPKAFFRVVVSN